MAELDTLAPKIHIGICDNCGEKKKLARWGSHGHFCHACYMYERRTGQKRPCGIEEKVKAHLGSPAEVTHEEFQTLNKRFAAKSAHCKNLEKKIEELEGRIKKLRAKNKSYKKLLTKEGYEF